MKKRFVNSDHDLNAFASCGNREDFESIHLKWLSNLADYENWTSPENNGHPFDILFYYIIKTFEVISKQNKIVYNDKKDFCLFNTGLMTENGEEIYGCFIPNTLKGGQKWFLKGFFKESDRFLSNFVFNKPEVARYDSNINEFHFDSTIDIEFNGDHIFDDHWDDEGRFPDEVKKLGKKLAISSILAAFDVTKKKVQRNLRLAVPQYYMGKITFLLPIKVNVPGDKTITMALAIEKMPNNTYRANTIFNLHTAYKKARLITKPESNWLIE